jgi:hypothetical protein
VPAEKKQSRYVAIIERIFASHYNRGDEEVIFARGELEQVAKQLKVQLPKNLGDLIYSFRYRAELPSSITAKAPKGKSWIIRPAGQSRYKFVATTFTSIIPNPAMSQTKVPDAMPGVIAMYALSDEQALLAKLRYNRLVDIFLGITCYSLQSHLRTQVSELGQLETDELYVGLDRRGAHFVIPIQAKGGKDRLSIVQIEQDFAMCEKKFPSLICRPVAAQFLEDDAIALFAFEKGDKGIGVVVEKHYRLVPAEQMTPEDVLAYQKRPVTE